MAKQVEFYFDVGSPTAYLAFTQIRDLAERAGAEVVWRPMLLGGVFKATGNASPITVPAKGRYMGRDIARYVKRYGVPFRFNPHFPINTLHLMRGAVHAESEQKLEAYLDAVFPAIWARELDMGDPAVVAEVLREAGFDPAAFARAIEDEGVKEGLKKRTEAAVERGVFGAPTFFVGEEMFWGQDRLDFVEEALRGD